MKKEYELTNIDKLNIQIIEIDKMIIEKANELLILKVRYKKIKNTLNKEFNKIIKK